MHSPFANHLPFSVWAPTACILWDNRPCWAVCASFSYLQDATDYAMEIKRAGGHCVLRSTLGANTMTWKYEPEPEVARA